MENILKSLQILRLIEPGEKLVNDGKYSEAVSFFTKLIEKYPNESVLYDKRASCYIYLENAEQAIEDSTNAISLDNFNLKSYFRNLRCYVFLGNIKKAKYYAENGLKYSKKSNISNINNELFQIELDNINKIQDLLNSAKQSYYQKHFIDALKYLEEAFLIADPTLEQRTKLKKGVSILGNVITNGVCKEWQLFRGKILLKCKQYLVLKKIASTMEKKYPSYLYGQFFTIYVKYIYDEITVNQAQSKLREIIKKMNNEDDNENDFFDNDDIVNEILDFLKQSEELESLRNKYNDEYKQGNYYSADHGYFQCLKIYNKYELYSISYIKLLSNLSNTKSKLNNYKLSSEYSTKAIELLETFVFGSNNKKLEIKIREINKSLLYKSLFKKLYMRRASSYRQQQYYTKAINDYEFLLELLPNDNEMKKALNDTKNENEYNNNNNNNSNNNNKSNYKNNIDRMNQDDNYYTILGLNFADNPNTDTIKKAFHKMALKYHPDKCQNRNDNHIESAEKKFKRINEAYSVLSNPELKQSYDNKLKYSNFFKVSMKPKPNIPKKKTVSTDELLDQFIKEENSKKFFFGLF
ncbi:DnaJ-domain-containing protein [Anaeromyces robustus]|uniref:DnaJ-domain-containing protein n=1 Tax=Anaeromyces robustus TaxID=1754192 RepID=A0A1Y1WPM4_9FUNG|nr:DnaJ-domain-containing protein [Anaeromyces robustus]|eukprot:ORX75074.1 DnaJ-domain-containing protein [Anaeromyces robustus]